MSSLFFITLYHPVVDLVMSPDLSFFVTDPERHDEKVDEFTFFFFLRLQRFV